MKKVVSALVLVMGLAVSGVAQVGTVVEDRRSPEDRLRLDNGQVGVIAKVELCKGLWLVSGGVTSQVTVDNPALEGHFLYTFAAVTDDPSFVPANGTTVPDARPYVTTWFELHPTTYPFEIEVYGNEMKWLYLVVVVYGQIPPLLPEAFGSLNAVQLPDRTDS